MASAGSPESGLLPAAGPIEAERVLRVVIAPDVVPDLAQCLQRIVIGCRIPLLDGARLRGRAALRARWRRSATVWPQRWWSTCSTDLTKPCSDEDRHIRTARFPAKGETNGSKVDVV